MIGNVYAEIVIWNRDYDFDLHSVINEDSKSELNFKEWRSAMQLAS
jgi:hypothetical protein